jgi:hypothetical protein
LVSSHVADVIRAAMLRLGLVETANVGQVGARRRTSSSTAPPRERRQCVSSADLLWAASEMAAERRLC